ncbi:unnamed protein product [Notodromas monacha]|uniref:Threonylcarbamoyl-AMP synthase n=1 Tax=Notodromas monacha TaxID=399045 RepID=A0A7R9BI23_9CRUS|nr:unnamed protein product [Notodromas monacha]CAG0915604.1 unnamed protein product [Notodromas monacha]
MLSLLARLSVPVRDFGIRIPLNRTMAMTLEAVGKCGVDHEHDPESNSSKIMTIFDSESVQNALIRAERALRRGEVIAVPTDTIYGIAALVQSPKAIRSIYQIKGRDALKPLAICVGDAKDVGEYCDVTVDQSILADLFPGPVTLCFPRSKVVNPDLNPGIRSLGVRIPDSDFIRKLAQVVGAPLALTSANLSGQPSALDIHEFSSIWPSLGLVVDAGPLESSRLGSTVVDLSQSDANGRCSRYKIIREGSALRKTQDVLAAHGLLCDAS